jgi:hypothetical protein
MERKVITVSYYNGSYQYRDSEQYVQQTEADLDVIKHNVKLNLIKSKHNSHPLVQKETWWATLTPQDSRFDMFEHRVKI